MKAKKSFGQHFLVNEQVAIDLAKTIEGYDRVIEVGPGRGMLTKHINAYDKNFKVIEADRDMVKFLKKNKIVPRENIILEDFLKVDLYDIFEKEQFALVGNYPYNISTQIVFKTIENRDQIPFMAGMFQYEVAKRIASGPGSKVYGILSVLTQAFYDVEFLFAVEPYDFSPPPKVRSGIISMTRKEDFTLPVSYKLFKSIVKMAFGQRRKMLRNSLRSFFKEVDISEDPMFQERPEKLSVDDFIKITQRLTNILND